MKTLIKNAKIITMTGENYENGCVLFDEKILYVGSDENQSADEVIDAQGLTVMPGLIDAHCHVGMFEDSMGFEGADGNEDSDPITPHLRAIDGINPFDRAFKEAKNAGVTTVVTGPGSANPVGGQFAAVKTDGICIDDMIIKAPCAMKFALGENPKSVYSEKDDAPVTRMGTMALIRELLIKSKEYTDKLDAYEENSEENEKPEFDMKYDAMLPVLRKEIPVKIHAHRADDICSAIRIGKEFDILVTLEHCSDGDAVLPVLMREKLPVMLGPTLSDRSKIELKNLTFATYKNLSDNGIDVAIITDHPEITIENLPLCSVMAVKHGMNEEKALEAITIIAAKNCYIADRVGSLEVGKDADIAVFTDLPTRFDAECTMTFINGKKVK
ncbi:MAG: amidohydrolase [Clostridia bacterium]|nr:amidohydrolase [Clostridia bacterium]